MRKIQDSVFLLKTLIECITMNRQTCFSEHEDLLSLEVNVGKSENRNMLYTLSLIQVPSLKHFFNEA